MRKQFDISDDKEVRLWNKYMTNTYEHLNKLEQTLQEAGLYSGQIIVIEQKNEDGTWPRQTKRYCSITISLLWGLIANDCLLWQEHSVNRLVKFPCLWHRLWGLTFVYPGNFWHFLKIKYDAFSFGCDTGTWFRRTLQYNLMHVDIQSGKLF